MVVTIPSFTRLFSHPTGGWPWDFWLPSTAIEIQGANPPETPLECWNERQLGCDVPEGKTKTQRDVETNQMFPNLPVVGLTYTWDHPSGFHMQSPKKGLVFWKVFFLGGGS